jgi:hypothetical protein
MDPGVFHAGTAADNGYMLVFFDNEGQRFFQLKVGLCTSQERQKQEGQKGKDEQTSCGRQKVILLH